MEPVWMNAYHCVFDRSFEQYVDEIPQAEELLEALQQRNMMFCWLYTPKLEEVMIAPGQSTMLELVGASYSKENGYPVQTAKFYRYTHTGDQDFIMITEDGEIHDSLTFEQLFTEGTKIDSIQNDLR